MAFVKLLPATVMVRLCLNVPPLKMLMLLELAPRLISAMVCSKTWGSRFTFNALTSDIGSRSMAFGCTFDNLITCSAFRSISLGAATRRTSIVFSSPSTLFRRGIPSICASATEYGRYRSASNLMAFLSSLGVMDVMLIGRMTTD